MPRHIISYKIQSTPDENFWSQVHEFVPEDVEKIKKRGSLYAVISAKKKKIEKDDDQKDSQEQYIDIVSLGREVLTRLHEEYYGNLEKSPFSALSYCIQRVRYEFIENFDEIEIVAASVIGNVCYLCAIGGGQIAIVRSGGFAKIIESQKDKAVCASGFSKDGDFLILATNTFFQNISQNEIVNLFSKEKAESAVDNISSLVQSSSDKVSLAILNFLKKDSEKLKKIISDQVDQKDQSLEKEAETNSLKEKVGNILSKIPARPLVVKQEAFEKTNKRKKLLVILGFILIFSFFVSISIGVSKKNKKDFRDTYDEELNTAKHYLEESKNLFEVDKDRSRELFIQARGIANSFSDKELEDEEVIKLRSEIESEQSTIMGEYYPQAALYSDLTLLSSGFKAADFTYSDDEVVVFDRENQKIAKINLDTKRSELLSTSGVDGEIKSIALYFGNLYLLTDEGIYSLNGGGADKVLDKNWSDNVLISSFASNLYLLDKTNSDILRFSSTEDGFSSGRSWLGDGVFESFSDSVKMLIDGSIWVLKESSDIIKFDSGNQTRFSLATTIPPIEKIDSFFIDEEVEYLFVLEKNKQRIISFTKDGKYSYQLFDEKIGFAGDLVVSKDQNKVFVHDGEKIYELELPSN